MGISVATRKIHLMCDRIISFEEKEDNWLEIMGTDAKTDSGDSKDDIGLLPASGGSFRADRCESNPTFLPYCI